MPVTGVPVLIHPGFPKTGTTTLQDSLFGPHESIGCLAKPYLNGCEAFVAEMRKPEGYYDSNLAEAIVTSAIQEQPNRSVWTVSAEGFAHNVYNRALIARRLAALFPSSEVLFTIRNQFECVRSVYETVGLFVDAPRPYGGRVVQFEPWLEYELENHPLSRTGEYLFDETIAFFETAFGRERITVLMLEEFRDQREAWLEKLSCLLGLPLSDIQVMLKNAHSYKSPTAQETWYRQIRSRIAPGLSLGKVWGAQMLRSAVIKSLGVGGSRGQREGMNEEIRSRLVAIYAPGNARLQESYGVPLREYGYPTE